MDSVTQAALGAVVGAVVAGPRAPKKALLWGAVAGTLPDLDILYNFFTDDVGRLVSHRGITHSFVVMPFAAYILSRLVVRVAPRVQLSQRRWFWLFFWCFITHIVLDWMTVYGTQIFNPISSYPYALASLFIIDPFYTIPLLGAIVWVALTRAEAVKRQRVLIGALLITTSYLLASVVGKYYAEHQFKDALAAQQITYQKLETLNSPFNIVIWRAVVVSEDAIINGWYSLLSPAKPIQFMRTPKYPRRAEIDALAKHSRALAELIRFSKGFYRYKESDVGVEWIDLRFGVAGSYPFRYLVAQDEAGVLRLATPVERSPVPRRRPSADEIFDEVWRHL